MGKIRIETEVEVITNDSELLEEFILYKEEAKELIKERVISAYELKEAIADKDIDMYQVVISIKVEE